MSSSAAVGLLLPDRELVLPAPILGPLTGPAAEQAAKSAIAKRAESALLPLMFSVQALLPQLPLTFPSDPTCSPSPKLRYRSCYRYLGPERMLEEGVLAGMSDLEISMRLIDFSPVRDELARIYRPSHKGQIPFDPVSMKLSLCLRREKKLSWGATARLLKSEEGAPWRRLFGFTDTDTPSASGLRYFFGKVGPEFFDDLCPRSIEMLSQHHLLPEHSTFPGDPVDRGVTVTQDGMLHQAKNQHCCQLATDQCYQALPKEQLLAEGKAPPVDGEQHSRTIQEQGAPSPVQEQEAPSPVQEREAPSPVQEREAPSPVQTSAPAPEASDGGQSEGEPKPTRESGTGRAPEEPVACPPQPSGRPCRAREKGLEGCSCDSQACQQQCRRASTLDPEARFIHYQGGKGKHGDGQDSCTGGLSKEKSKGKDNFGYRSVADRILDDRFAAAWTARSHLYTATTDERTIFKEGVSAFKTRLEQVKVGEWLDDSGVGYADCLNAIYDMGALRMVDIRADKGDTDFEVCLKRGYDGKGYPLCCHGYVMHPNGYDNDRRRAKWVCDHACTREPRQKGEPVAPVEGCPYLEKDHPWGQVRNVGRAFPDGSVRLAREIPYGSEAWKARYGRRNLSESRNGQMEGLGLKRMVSYGLPRDQKEVQLADFLLNLHTLGRLVRQATRIRQG